MKRVLFLLMKRSTLFLLFLYVTSSFLLMNTNDAMVSRGVRLLVLQVTAWTGTVEKHFYWLKNEEKENEELKKRNFTLSINNLRLQEAMLENIRLRRLLEMKKRSDFKFITANIIGYGEERNVRSLVLNVGTADSAKKNMVVMTELGLVGKIVKTTPHQSIAQVLMDRNSLVSARLQKSREVGVVSWNGNFWLDLNYIPNEVPVERGELVVTSGLSRIYPKGLKIGVVAEVKTNEYELFKEIKIKPAVDFNSLEEVFVLITPDSLQAENGFSE